MNAPFPERKLMIIYVLLVCVSSVNTVQCKEFSHFMIINVKQSNSSNNNKCVIPLIFSTIILAAIL